MTRFRTSSAKKIDTVFVFALLLLFAATSFALVLIGAKQYRAVSDTISQNDAQRTACAYLAEKLRQSDAAGAVYISEFQGIPALTICTETSDAPYTTYIYFYETALRELTVTDQAAVSHASGQEILALKDFSVTMPFAHLLKVTLTHTDGETQTLFFSRRAPAGKEVL